MARSSLIEREEVPRTGSSLVTRVASTSHPASASHNLEQVADHSLEAVVSLAFLAVAGQALAIHSLRKPVADHQGAWP